MSSYHSNDADDADVGGFYRAFEERYRGSRETIKERVKAYLPFVTPLLALYRPTTAVDLGCGRGEWLELLQEEGFAPQGVDLDAHMLRACAERGLPAQQGEAVGYLKSLANASQCIVSGFHIAEHIAFADLQTLVIEALRVLKPGGLLILETPNPENLVVGTSSFYLDPTHLRPLPPLLLSFLPDQYGYARAKILRLQASFNLESDNEIQLIEVIEGVSRDYAVVAQKEAPPATLALFDAAFDTPYGVEQYSLASRYDKRIFERMEALDRRMANAEEQTSGMNDALSCIASLHEQLRDTEQRARAAEQQARAAEQQARAAEQQARAAEQQANTLALEKTALLESLSWRITGPLRFVGGVFIRPTVAMRRLANGLLHSGIETFQRPLAAAMRFVLRHSALSHRLNQRLMRYPALYQQLLGVARRHGATTIVPSLISASAATKRLDHAGGRKLTPRARQIYDELKTAMDSKRQEKH